MSVDIFTNPIFVIINSILFWLTVFYYIGVLKEKNRLVEFEILLSNPIDYNIPTMLDQIIGECFNEYIAMNEGFKETTVTEKREEELLRILSKKVTERLSKQIQTKLSTYYDLSNIEQIIADKCFMYITSYSIDNRDLKENPKMSYEEYLSE